MLVRGLIPSVEPDMPSAVAYMASWKNISSIRGTPSVRPQEAEASCTAILLFLGAALVHAREGDCHSGACLVLLNKCNRVLFQSGPTASPNSGCSEVIALNCMQASVLWQPNPTCPSNSVCQALP